MDDNLIAVLGIAGTLVGVMVGAAVPIVLGWVGNRRADGAILGRALAELLEVRVHLLGRIEIRRAMEEMIDRLGVAATQAEREQAYGAVFALFAPQPGWEKGFDEAALRVAEIDPVLGWRIRGKDAALRLHTALPNLAPTPQDRADYDAFVRGDQEAMMLTALNEAALELARKHGHAALQSVRYQIDVQDAERRKETRRYMEVILERGRVVMKVREHERAEGAALVEAFEAIRVELEESVAAVNAATNSTADSSETQSADEPQDEDDLLPDGPAQKSRRAK